MVIKDYDIKRRALHNALTNAILALQLVNNSSVATYEERLKCVTAVQNLLPDIRRFLIYFNNVQKGL